MAKTKVMNRSLGQLLHSQGDLVTRRQALECGMSEGELRHRLRPDGPWIVVLPGIYYTHNGLLAVGQQEIAALLYAGSASVISGRAALARQGVRVPLSGQVDVLVPHDRRLQSVSFVDVHRTKRLPEQIWRTDGLRWAPVARAVADAARIQTDLRAVRAFVASAVQQRKCTIGQLAAELEAGPRKGSATLRAALEEVIAGADSVAEAEFIALVKAAGLPEPLYNHSLYAGTEFLAKPDAWWPDAGVAVEIDSREWHLLPADWTRTMTRHEKMSAHGILVLHFTPSRLRTEPRQVTTSLAKAIHTGQQRPPLPIRAIASR